VKALALVDEDVARGAALATDLLVDELARWVPALRDEIGDAEGEPDRKAALVFVDDDAGAPVARVLWLDAALVFVLHRVDPDEAQRARDARAVALDDPADRWLAWDDPIAPDGLVRLAAALWRCRVADVWRRAVARPPALRVPFVERWRALTSGRMRVDADGLVLDPAGEVVARFDPLTVDSELVRRVLAACRGPLGHGLVMYLTHGAHKATSRPGDRPGVVRVEGGLGALAEALGRTGGRARNTLADVVRVGAALRLSGPWLNVSCLWIVDEIRATRGRKAALVFVVADILRPGSGSDLKAAGNASTRAAKAARALVPIPANEIPHRLPNDAERGPALSVGLGVLVRLVKARDQLRSGGVVLDLEAWAELVVEAGLGRGRASALRTLMLEGDGTAGPLLERNGPDRFTLARAHAAELAFIVEHRQPRAGVRGRSRDSQSA